jgi:hypothetical protein
MEKSNILLIIGVMILLIGVYILYEKFSTEGEGLLLPVGIITMGIAFSVMSRIITKKK